MFTQMATKTSKRTVTVGKTTGCSVTSSTHGVIIMSGDKRRDSNGLMEATTA